MLENLPFWSHLTDDQQQQLVRFADLRRYRKGQQLYSSSEECLGMIMVESGSIRTYIVSQEGREITLFKLGEGESCVLSVACVLSEIQFETQIMAAADARLRIVPAGVFDRLFRENVYVRVSTESEGAEIYKSFNYEIFERRPSVVIAMDGNSAGENLIQEARNGKGKSEIFVWEKAQALRRKAESLEGYVHLFGGNAPLAEQIRKLQGDRE